MEAVEAEEAEAEAVEAEEAEAEEVEAEEACSHCKGCGDSSVQEGGRREGGGGREEVGGQEPAQPSPAQPRAQSPECSTAERTLPHFRREDFATLEQRAGRDDERGLADRGARHQEDAEDQREADHRTRGRAASAAIVSWSPRARPIGKMLPPVTTS